MSKTKTSVARPPIRLSESDAEKLSDLAAAVEGRLPEVAKMLFQEIDRAKIVPDAKVPEDVVKMHSTVEFLDESSGRGRTVQLVYPADADIQTGAISILTPIGAGLIGLREGQSIAWPNREGKEQILKIVKVSR